MVRLRELGAIAAVLAAVALAADAVLGLAADTDDHTRGAGLASELLFAAVLVLVAAVALALHELQRARATGAWRAVEAAGLWLALAGLLASAVVALSVPVRGEEPPDSVSTPVVLAALLGLVVFGVAAARLRAVPWWVGAFLAVFFPVVFVGGAVGALLAAAAWLAVGAALRRAAEPGAPASPA